MMRHLYLALLLLTALSSLPATAAGLSASLDRNPVGEGESVELRLQSDDATQIDPPDLAALEQDFEILGTTQESVPRLVNGKTQGSLILRINLLPRSTGELPIPALQLGSASSQPLTLRVTPALAIEAGRRGPVFIEASLDQPAVYVQAQAILTLRIHHSVSLFKGYSLTEPQLGEARVEQLGAPRTYEKTIGNVPHGVIELSYAIFAQKSGNLKIPALLFSARIADRQESGTGGRGKAVRVKSPELTLQVKPKPASFPADAVWLPARALTLNEAWSSEPGQLQLGDSLTRNLLLNADGLTAAQLPPLPLTTPKQLRRYPDQPILANQINDDGIIGSREESDALVPTRSGKLLLPAIELLWWNTVEDRLEIARVAERLLTVTDNPQLQPVQGPDLPLLANGEVALLWPWQLSTAVLALTSLLGFGLWWHARRQPAVVPTVQSGPSPRTLLDDLKRACTANDPQQTRQALDAWARQQPETLADMGARFAPLADALNALNGALYSTNELSWDGKELWQAIRSLPPTESTGGGENSALPPLYPR
jgi:hypothetical protein